MYAFFARLMEKSCRFALRRPVLFFLLTLAVSVPAVIAIQHLYIDTNLVRLLPGHSRASSNTRDLSAVIGDGGYFTLVLRSEETNRMAAAMEDAAARIRGVKGVHVIEYKWPVEFFRRHRYHLVPNDYMHDIYDKIVGWKAELSPAGDNLLSDSVPRGDDGEADANKASEDSMEQNIRQFANLYEYHRSADAQQYGMIIRTASGVTSFGEMNRMMLELEKIAAETAERHGVWGGIGGSHRNKIDEFRVINGDLGLATLIAGGLIILTLIIGFRYFSAALIVLLPLGMGMLWGFALVAELVGSLNLITAFLTLILTGMGVDYAIHLLKRLEHEMVEKDFQTALLDTFRHSGPPVLVSGLTTALSLAILVLSDFLGFSEFGLLSAMVLGTILLAMYTALPAVMVLAWKLKRIKARDHARHKAPMASRWVVRGILAFLVVSLALAASGTKFDTSFRNLQFDRGHIAGLNEIRASQRSIYNNESLSPGALFLARDEAALDALIAVFGENAAKRGKDSTIANIRSVRDYAPRPDSAQWKERLELLSDIKEELAEGDWIARIKNEERKNWIEEMRDWKASELQPPRIADLPDAIRVPMQANDGSGQFILTVFPSVDRKSSKNAIRFTEEIYQLELPPGVVGPVGETPVFAEIVMVVKSEVWWLMLLTFAGVFFFIWLDVRRVRDVLLILLPLGAGLLATFGVMAIVGFPLNLFNVIVLPALIGMGVDDGVHFFDRWKENRRDSRKTFAELLNPMFITTFTTTLGYAGMIFAHHPGLRSIGLLALLGMMLIWATTVYLLPAVLDFIGRKKAPA